jgi:hypothetical protein
MIIRTIDNVFVNLDSIAKIRFNPESSETIEIVYPFKMEGDDYYYDVDYPLADMFADKDIISLIMNKFIKALVKKRSYFDFGEAYFEAYRELGYGDRKAAEDISRTYDGKRD